MSDRARVAVLDDYQKVALASADWAGAGSRIDVQCFADHVTDEEELAGRLADFDVVVLMRERTPFPAALIRRLPRLRLLVTTGERNAAIDVAAAAGAGVLVCGTRGLVSPTVELTWALILGLLRALPAENTNVRTGRWQQSLGEGLEGKVLGIVGLGRIGSRVARIASAFNMPVVAWSQHLTEERAVEAGARRVGQEELFRSADIVTVHLKLSPRTRSLIGEPQLRSMKPEAYFINTSRAEIVDGDALIRALTDGWIAGAGIDVYQQEPLPPDHRILGAPNTLLTPHLGYVVRQNYEVFYSDALDDILAFLDGKPVRVIAPE